MLTPEKMASPGSMIAQRQYGERIAEQVFLEAATQVSRATVEFALSSHTLPSPIALQEQWVSTTQKALNRYDLPEDEHSWLYEVIAGDTMPSEMYDTAAAVVMDSVTHSYSRKHFEEELRRALDLETGDVEQIPDALTAALKFFGTSWLKRIKRKARTTGTRWSGWLTQNGIMILGIPHKRWVTRRDTHVRESHAAIDGMTIPTHDLFPVGGYSLEYPGESSGPPEEVINCRCVLTAVLRP